jgi:hypothetical protein
MNKLKKSKKSAVYGGKIIKKKSKAQLKRK